MKTRREPSQAWLWTTDAVVAAVTLGIIYGVICCLPLIAPYGIRDLFSHLGLEAAR